jgi:hypothetical protein
MKNLPKNLDECLAQLKETVTEDIQVWIDTDEDEAMYIHHGFGTYLRNEWKLWEQDTELSTYFASIGILHGDDRSGIILTSFHRMLNGKDINLKEQVQVYWKHWKACNERSLIPGNIEGISDEYLELYNKM